MRHKRTVFVPATTREEIASVTCDFCGAVIEKADSYDATAVTIGHESGTRYPEGGSGFRVWYDCCVSCWDKKVNPLLRSTALEPPTIEDWDY